MKWENATLLDNILILGVIAFFSCIIGFFAAEIALVDYENPPKASTSQWLFESVIAFAGGITRIIILDFRNVRDFKRSVRNMANKKAVSVR